MKLEPQSVILLFGYILLNAYYTYIIVTYSKDFGKVEKEKEFKDLLMKTPEYKNQNIDKKFIKFFSKINKYYLSDSDAEKIYFDSLEGKELRPMIRFDKRRNLYVLSCLILVVNCLFTFNLIANNNMNTYIKFILVIIQLFFLYNLFLVIKNLSDDNRIISLDLLEKTIFFVWICLLTFIMNLFNIFGKNSSLISKVNTKSEKNNSSNKSINENNLDNKSNKNNSSGTNIEKILRDNEKFLSNVSQSLKK